MNSISVLRAETREAIMLRLKSLVGAWVSKLNIVYPGASVVAQWTSKSTCSEAWPPNPEFSAFMSKARYGSH